MNKKRYIVLLFVVLILYHLFYFIGTIRVAINFKELEPFRHKIPVYYKGFKLGNTTKIRPGKDYNTTVVEIRIKDKGIKFPKNTTAVIRRKDKKDYIELIYPETPYLETLRTGSSIEGVFGVNFEHYLQDQASNGGLDEIKDNVNNTIKSAGLTFDALTEMINFTTLILEDIRPTIKDTVYNINLASKDLSMTTERLKLSVEKGYIDNSLYNFEQTTKNLVVTSENMNGFTGNINKQSVCLLNCLINNVNIVIKNINQIVVGLGNTLKERFGGLKLFLGIPIK